MKLGEVAVPSPFDEGLPDAAIQTLDLKAPDVPRDRSGFYVPECTEAGGQTTRGGAHGPREHR
jgi:hypothetical protein